MRRDPYEVLGVARDADDKEIKKTFRRVARELHPDVNRHDPEAEEKFKEAAEAYEILSDAERRATYDRYGFEGLDSRGFSSQAHGFGSFADIFDAFFGGDPFGGAFGRGGAGRIQGGDLAVEVEISLAEAATGKTVDVSYELVDVCEHCHGNGAEPGTPIETCPQCGGAGRIRAVTRTAFGQLVREQACDACGGEGRIPSEPCHECQGRGRRAVRKTLQVDVPPGIADEQRIRLSGRGHAGERGGPPGDLYVVVRVSEDERFLRDGSDLVTVVDVPAPAAALGTTVSVPTLDGDEEIEVPAGTQPGTVVTLRERGMPTIGRGRRGDQQVVLNVVIPRNLSARQSELLEELRESLTAENLEEQVAGVAALEGQAGAALIRLAIRAPARARRAGARRAARARARRLRAGGRRRLRRVRALRRPGRAAHAAHRPRRHRRHPRRGLGLRGWRRLGQPLARISQTGTDRSPSRAPAVDRPAQRGHRHRDRPRAGLRHRRAPDDAALAGAAPRRGGRAARRRRAAGAALPPLVDLGCGSGVLAIAAAKLGFAPVTALDHDPAAIEATLDNARANGVTLERVERYDLREQPAPVAPVMTANLMRPLLLRVAALLPEQPETLIVSGLLEGEEDVVAAAFSPLLERRRQRLQGWSALLLTRP